MTAAKKIYPGTGGAARKKTQNARTQVLRTDVTPGEKKVIVQHCIQNKISVSQFLADTALEDARTSSNEEQEFTFRLSRDQARKLLLLARLKEKSATDLIPELLLPPLANKWSHGTLEIENLSLYLTEEEHGLLMKHIEKKGMSARNYIAMLALEKIAKQSSRERKKKKLPPHPRST